MKSKRILQILTLIFCLLLVSTQWIQVEAKDYQIDRKTVKEMLSYEYDEAVFTAYAFMNYTGFNDNNGMPFSQVREGVRKDLQKKNPKLKDNHYFNNKGFESYFYPGFLLVTNGAPHFQPVHYHKIPENVRRNYGFLSTAIEAGMGEALAEFYVKADIPSLYNKYKPQYEAEINYVVDQAIDKVQYIFNAFKLDPKQAREKMVMDVNFLMEMGRAETFPGIPDYRRGEATWMQYGPNPNNREDGTSAVHELMHSYVNPILEKHRDKVKRFIISNEIVPAGSYGGYEMVDEIFVRAIECIAKGEYVNHDYIQFPRSEDIFNFYYTDYDRSKDNLESFILKALDAFTEGGGQGDYDQGYKDGLADGSAKINEDRKKYRAWETEKNVAKNKAWTVSFDLDLDLSTVREKNIFVSHSSGGLHPVLYVVDRDKGTSSVQLVPARDYRPGETYTLWIKDVKAKNGKTLSQWTLMDFTIAPAK